MSECAVVTSVVLMLLIPRRDACCLVVGAASAMTTLTAVSSVCRKMAKIQQTERKAKPNYSDMEYIDDIVVITQALYLSDITYTYVVSSMLLHITV